MKLIKEPFANETTAEYLVREIRILRKLTEMENNTFITRLVDILMPNKAIVSDDDNLQTNASYCKISSNETNKVR